MEFSNLDRKSNKLQKSLQQKELRNYRLVHDASCESMREFFADTDFPIEFTDKIATNKQVTVLAFRKSFEAAFVGLIFSFAT